MMQNSQNIEFVCKLFCKLHISVNIIEEPEKSIPSKIDKGLRAMLFGETDYAKLLFNSPLESKEKIIYRFFDEYMCHYIFFRIPDKKPSSYFFVGPYLSSLPSEEYFTRKSQQLLLSEEKSNELRSYYRNLPIAEDENLLLSIMDTLGSFLWGGENEFNIEYINYEIPDKRRPAYSAGIFDDNDSTLPSLTLDIISQNYQNEKKLMEAVSKGKLNMVDVALNSILNQGIEERLSDSLRNRKNYLIILNTLLRKAAEYGEVHPYHIHRLSSSFAKKIEELYSLESSLELQKEMIRKYCMLVKEHSLKKYSNLIGRVITLISYDLTADLSLKHIAEVMNVNASYLSASFKKECGKTLTAYVNSKRMEMASFILSHSNKQIQTVAEECGILDMNYFIKLFKKQFGLTPTQYRNNTK